jgi:GNAT superfamily N-acetyltransferase
MESKVNIIEQQRDGYTISTDRTRLDIGLIHDFLSEDSYWAQGRPYAVVEESIEHSLCFGIYAGTEQVAFARVVTDYATFAWLCDVFVVESHRGRGLGKWLVESVVAHPDLDGIWLFILATRDAHGLYRRYAGFETLEVPEKWMVRHPSPS